jgi:hypothetical protein
MRYYESRPLHYINRTCLAIVVMVLSKARTEVQHNVRYLVQETQVKLVVAAMNLRMIEYRFTIHGVSIKLI